MRSYLDHLDAFGFPASLQAMIRGGWIFPEDLEWHDPVDFESFPGPHPPALIPLNFGGSGDGHTFIGAWKHWFTPGRSMTYVKFLNENGHVYEEGRSPEQLVARLLGERESAMIPRNLQGSLDCLARLGLTVDDLPSEDDDGDVLDIALHPRFGLDWPREASYSPADLDRHEGHPYLGDFPPGTDDGYRSGPLPTPDQLRALYQRRYPLEMLRRCSEAEIYGETIREYVPDAPPWFLTEDDQPKVFDALLEAGDLSGAWMSLNSSGWRPKDLGRALASLADKAGDPSFSLLAGAWLAAETNEQ